MRKVVDAATRTYHWLFAASFVGAYITADSEMFRLLHVTLGYTMIGLLVFRVLWGIVGPRQMRLSAMFRKLQGFKGLVAAYRAGEWLQTPQLKQSVNLLMTMVIVALLFAVIPLTLSGYVVFNELAGEWVEEIHEFFGEFMLYLVVMHLVMIAIVSVIRRSNLAKSMLTGYVAGTGPDLIKQDYKWVAVSMMAGVTVWMLWYMVV